MLNKQKHEIILKQILGGIFQHKELQTQLAFKGGTCLYIFHDLPRFSTDLDFNLTSDKLSTEAITQILKEFLTIEDFRSKQHTWFWLGSYEKGTQKIKVEVSKRDFPDKYEYKDFLGITIPAMTPEYMFAHKLCAITDRRKLQNRDLFDSWFMFKQLWEPNAEIIKIRTQKTIPEYYKELIRFIDQNASQQHILDGLGEVLDDRQKNWTREHLVAELVFQLQIRITGK